MRSGITNRRALLAIMSVLAMLMAVLAAAPAAAHGSRCDDRHVHRHGHTWKVYPNGTNDTANVECALVEASHHDGAIVKLAKGTFYLDFLAVDDFNGILRGSGRDHTRVEPLRGGLDCVAEYEATGFVVWIVFTSSHVKVKDLSFAIPDVACAEPYLEDIFFDEEIQAEVGFVAQDFGFIVGSVSRSPAPTDTCEIREHGSLHANRVNVYAPVPDLESLIFNPQGAFSAFRASGTIPLGCADFDDLVGDVSIRNVTTHGVGNLVEVTSMYGAKVTVKHNHVSEADAAILLTYNERSTYKVKKNHLDTIYGAGIIVDNCVFGPEGPLCAETASRGYLMHNHVAMAPFADIGVGVFDGPFDELLFPALLDVKVARNSISHDEGFAGVAMFGNDGTTVVGNHFEGSALFGVIVGGQQIAEFKGVNSKIVLNSFVDLLAFEAGILLEPLTAHNVVAWNRGATVVDLGMDNYVRNNSEPEATLEMSLFRTETAERASGYTADRYRSR